MKSPTCFGHKFRPFGDVMQMLINTKYSIYYLRLTVYFNYYYYYLIMHE